MSLGSKDAATRYSPDQVHREQLATLATIAKARDVSR